MQDQTTQLDQDAVNLAKAIRQTESGGNFQARGKSGEYGAYQFTKPTWDSYAKKHGVNTELEKATPEQQNEVAYKQIKEWKDQGYNPGQIASLWNSGKPDAYLDTSYKGKNKLGVSYDVPKYAESVAKAYQQIKAGGQVGVDPQNPSSIANDTPQEGQPNVLQKFAGSIIQPFEELGAGVLNKINEKTGIGNKVTKGAFGTDIKPITSTGQAVGDVVQGLSFGMPVGTIRGALAMGATQGVGQALSEGKTDIKDIGVEGLKGATTAGVLRGVGKGISALTQYLPERVVRGFLKTTPEQSKYALTKSLGNPEKMIQESDSSINLLGKGLSNVLKSPKYKGIAVSGDDILNDVLQMYPQSGLSKEALWDEVGSLVKLKAGLLDKLKNNIPLTLDEAHSLNSTLGSNIYKSVFDQPSVKAGKQIGNAVYQSISQKIKQVAPETVPVFDSLSKEYAINNAIRKLQARTDKAHPLTWADIITYTTGTAVNPLGGLVAYGAKKLAQSPTANLKVAGLINKLNKPTIKKIGQKSLPIITKGVLSNQ